MDSRAPRANRGAGVKRQGCYRPEAVSVGPKGHRLGHSLSISGGKSRLTLGRISQDAGNISRPDGPDDAAQFIRHGDRGFVVPAPVVQGDGWEQLKKGVGQSVGSVNPGQTGNIILSAHNDVYGELFRYLDKLAPGDQVVLYTQQRQYTYIVDRTAVVEPTAVEVMASTGSPTVTLISCYPYLVDKQRIVVFARLQS